VAEHRQRRTVRDRERAAYDLVKRIADGKFWVVSSLLWEQARAIVRGRRTDWLAAREPDGPPQGEARTELEDAAVRAIAAGLTPEQVEDAVERALRIAEGA
jgi:uncharacterized membrane protein YccC